MEKLRELLFPCLKHAMLVLQRGLGYSYYFVGRHHLHEQSRGLVCAYLMVFVSQYSDLILLISFQRYFHSHFGYLSKKNELNHTDLLFLSHLDELAEIAERRHGLLHVFL